MKGNYFLVRALIVTTLCTAAPAEPISMVFRIHPELRASWA